MNQGIYSNEKPNSKASLCNRDLFYLFISQVQTASYVAFYNTLSARVLNGSGSNGPTPHPLGGDLTTQKTSHRKDSLKCSLQGNLSLWHTLPDFLQHYQETPLLPHIRR